MVKIYMMKFNVTILDRPKITGFYKEKVTTCK